MFEATTILAYKTQKGAVIGGDGQVTFGNCVLKGNATKIRTLYHGKILSGFAGSTADAFTLFDMFEGILENKKGDLLKSVMEFSKEWRKDKYLRRLEAMMIVLDKEKIFILSGTGDVVEPEDGKIAAIGSGGNYALSAARALDRFGKGDMEPRDLVLYSFFSSSERFPRLISRAKPRMDMMGVRNSWEKLLIKSDRRISIPASSSVIWLKQSESSRNSFGCFRLIFVSK